MNGSIQTTKSCNYSAPYKATSLSAFRTFCLALMVVSMTDLSTAKQSAP
jgi:hypothetical protein